MLSRSLPLSLPPLHLYWEVLTEYEMFDAGSTGLNGCFKGPVCEISETLVSQIKCDTQASSV